MLIVHYKYLDTITSTITVNFKRQTIRVVNYTDNPIDTAFGRKTDISMRDFYELINHRCIPRDHYCSRDAFEMIGNNGSVDDNAILDIVKRTHGCMASDYYSMDFAKIEPAGDVKDTAVWFVPRIKKDDANPLKTGFVPCRGRQLKYKIAETWYKEDYFGYEAANTCFCNALLAHAQRNNRTVDYVPYRIEKINDNIYSVSEDFLGLNGQLYSIYDLYFHIRGTRFYEQMAEEKKFLCLIEFMEKELHLAGAGEYLTLLLEWDAFVLNKPRTAKDIYVIREGNDFFFAPIFNHDSSWLGSLGRKHPYSTMLDFARNYYGRQLFLDMDYDYTDTFNEIRNIYSNGIADKLQTMYLYQKALHKI